MKPVGCLSKFLAGGVALATILAVCSAQAATGSARVKAVRGTASYAEQGSDWKPLKAGTTLAPGTTVRTGVDGGADLDIGANGPDVRLLDGTSLGLDRLNMEKTGADTVVETQLNLTAGTIAGTVRRLPAGSKYEVKTPSAVVGIKGDKDVTKYVISANGVTHIIQGAAVIVYINPVTQQMSTHTVGAGQTFQPPIQPGSPGATPTVRPTRPDELPPEITPVVTAPSLVVVPSPEPFVSPIHPKD